MLAQHSFSRYRQWLFFLALGDEILGWVFGDPFKAGALALALLACRQLINATLGPVGMLLKMSDHENVAMRGLASAAVFNVLLNFSLVPNFGMAGAAFASALTLLWWNVLLRWEVRRRLKLEPSAFGLITPNRT